MIVWSIQNIEVWKILKSSGFYSPENKFVEEWITIDNDCQLKMAYDWLIQKMKDKNIVSDNIKYPIWSYFLMYGKRKCRSMKEKNFAPKNIPIVKLTIDIPDDKILLSDFDLWHFVLNNWYIPKNKTDEKRFNKKERFLLNKTLKFIDDPNYIPECEIPEENIILKNEIQQEKIKSWDKIFDISNKKEYTLDKDSINRTVQGTFFGLYLDQIKKTEFYTAK